LSLYLDASALVAIVIRLAATAETLDIGVAAIRTRRPHP